ncbi:hypothetical protein [Porphyromonas sp. oral taxon 278]|uniref:cell division protein FtsQ/DivIB n=1 Tax=Porphyromonas sp. oral taxon 278 TaxID=712437 RepID=UPI0025FD7E3B|nr:hypothetical protein [Porphyromonas sp. oral taxon 278]
MNRKIVVRNILLSLLALVMLGALVYLALSTPKVKAGDRCRRVAIEVKSETGGDPLFLTPDRIADELARRGIQLEGKRLDSIDLRHIERTLLSIPIYKTAEAFVAPSSSSVQIRLTEKCPLYIVQEPSGKSYYVTQGKGTISVKPSFAAYLPIVSGDVDLQQATSSVYDLMQVLREDPYFANYFGQVYVDRTDGIVLIPRIGTTRVIIGHSPNWAEKLRKWRIFAESVLPKRGMNAFSYVNLDYSNQVIARDRYAPVGELLDDEGEAISQPLPTPSPSPAVSTEAKKTPAPSPQAKDKTSSPAKEKAPSKDKPKEQTRDKAKDKNKAKVVEPKKDPKKDVKKEAKKPQAPKPAPAKKPNKPEPTKSKPNHPQKK